MHDHTVVSYFPMDHRLYNVGACALEQAGSFVLTTQ
jgi:hypothetical protein